jgi:hypothetical protein
MNVIVAQLPFPSTSDPHPALLAYYRDYSARFTSVIADYVVPEGSLWEMPLWVAHLCGMLAAIGQPSDFVDLSREESSPDACSERLLARTSPGDVVMVSPLAQNFDLACQVSAALMRAGRRTVIGGNMAALTETVMASFVYRGLLDIEGLRRMLAELESGPGLIQLQSPTRGTLNWAPDYSMLAHYHGRVPLLRLNASHGCLYACNFCGDAWSRKLYLVDPAVLEAEFSQFERYFPATRLIYIGDKTFGQSRQAVDNLSRVMASRPDYRLIVQTHINTISLRLIETMARLRVAVVEMGFETADPEILRQSNKRGASLEHHEAIFESLRAHGIRVVLNVLGGLPLETRESHAQTVAALERWRDVVWLHNLYSFVPYPLTPYFRELRPRIFNWNFADWREDSPPVYTPYFLSVEESWHCFLETIEVAHRAIGGTPVPGSIVQPTLALAAAGVPS